MSFTRDVKDELMKIKIGSSKGKELLLSGFAFAMKSKDEKLFYSTENERIFSYLRDLLKEYEYIYSERNFIISDKGVFNKQLPKGGDGEISLFLRGLFLANGVITDPTRSYHLEINILDENKCCELYNFINEQGIAVKKSIRKSKHFIYIKESEIISDFLTYIGAVVHSMQIMNAKILKEVRNNVNRTVNCETANIEKTTNAAIRQIADIKFIYNKKGNLFLPPELREVAWLRMNNVDMSLKEIGEALVPRISRSGVNHRFRKISEIAENLKNG